jgi:hypothetical protein
MSSGSATITIGGVNKGSVSSIAGGIGTASAEFYSWINNIFTYYGTDQNVIVQ